MDQGKTFETKGSLGRVRTSFLLLIFWWLAASSWAFMSGIQERGVCSITVANI